MVPTHPRSVPSCTLHPGTLPINLPPPTHPPSSVLTLPLFNSSRPDTPPKVPIPALQDFLLLHSRHPVSVKRVPPQKAARPSHPDSWHLVRIRVRGVCIHADPHPPTFSARPVPEGPGPASLRHPPARARPSPSGLPPARSARARFLWPARARVPPRGPGDPAAGPSPSPPAPSRPSRRPLLQDGDGGGGGGG